MTENKDVKSDNLRIYKQGCEVPKDALKEIKAGRLKGMSDVNPMWRMKRMTEIFGPCGIGWKYTIDRQWIENYGEEVKCFCNVSLYFRDPLTNEWSEAIPGNGGSAIVSKEKGGIYVNDEGYKMALTDALSIAMKPLGIGAGVWYGPKATGHNESKYEQYTNTSSTDTQLQTALAELECCNTRGDANALWTEWAKKCPSICVQNGAFFNAVSQKLAQLPES